MISISSNLAMNAVAFLHRKYKKLSPAYGIIQVFEKEFNCCLIDDLSNTSMSGSISFNTPESETAFILRFA
ncbi:MAG: hypothetical protein RLY43_391 [Bacteroidota bacterium]|jgi:hypothetical protein